MQTLVESEQLSELYRLYGVAAHHCCNIEYRIASLLLGPRWKEAKELNQDKVSEIYEELHTSTLGNLLKKYRQHFKFTDKQLGKMDLVLEKRNYLAHRFFGNYGIKMEDPKVLAEMILELNELIMFFQTASESLDPHHWQKE